MWFKKLSRNPLLEARRIFIQSGSIPLEFNYLNRTIFRRTIEEYLRYPSFPRAVPKIPRRLFCLFCFFLFKFIYIYQIIEITTRKSSANKFLKNEIKRLFLSFEEKWNFPSNLSFHSLFSFFFFFHSSKQVNIRADRSKESRPPFLFLDAFV